MATTKDPLNADTLNLDDAEERMAFYRALNASGRDAVGERLRRLRDRGILDANGIRVATHTPPDMLNPDSTVEQQ